MKRRGSYYYGQEIHTLAGQLHSITRGESMRRAGKGLGKRDISGKIAGAALAVIGVVILLVKLPSAFWWFLLGLALIFLGWRLFTR